MLTICVENHWVNASPDQVAQMMLDGRVDMLTTAKDSSQDNGEGPLMRYLRSAHYEELSSQLLQHVQAIYTGAADTVEPCRLAERVRELCQWDWPDAVIRGRLLWTAAWLAELTGSGEESIRYYDAFLQLDSGESHLRALAHNNRGVLLVRLGNAEGVEDLALAAMAIRLGARVPEQPATLPEACFNLLNLLNLAAQSRQLAQQVESVLVDLMVRLPREIREQWLGPDSDYELCEDNVSAAVDSSEQHRYEVSCGVTDAGELHSRISILTDPTFKRLNTFTVRLAAEAQNIVSGSYSQQEGAQRDGPCRLRLWLRRHGADVAGDWMKNDFDWQERGIQYTDYAEAASLLCAHEIPLALKRRQDSAMRAELLAKESLERAEQYLANGDYELARHTLELERETLGTFNSDLYVGSTLKQVQNLLKMVKQQQRKDEQLKFHEDHADLMRQVADFCRTTDSCQAQAEAKELRRQVNKFTVVAQEHQDRGYASRAVDLAERITRHLEELKRTEADRQVREMLQRLRERLPDDWTKPVPDDTYTDLTTCRLKDPQGRIEDWDRLKSLLDHHQAQYYFRTVLQKVSGDTTNGNEAGNALARALSLDQNLWVAAIPLSGLLSLSVSGKTFEVPSEIRSELLTGVSQSLDSSSSNHRVAENSDSREDLARQACYALQRLWQDSGCSAETGAEIWRTLQTIFTSIFAEAPLEAIEEIEETIETCLRTCPPAGGNLALRSDPRNPLRMFLESCRKVRLLGQAEELLNTKPPQYENAAKHFKLVIASGLDTPDQLRRAAAGLYLSLFGTQDAPGLQRHVLDELDAWVFQMAADQRGSAAGEDVIKQVEKIRIQTGTV